MFHYLFVHVVFRVYFSFYFLGPRDLHEGGWQGEEDQDRRKTEQSAIASAVAAASAGAFDSAAVTDSSQKIDTDRYEKIRIDTNLYFLDTFFSDICFFLDTLQKYIRNLFLLDTRDTLLTSSLRIYF